MKLFQRFLDASARQDAPPPASALRALRAVESASARDCGLEVHVVLYKPPVELKSGVVPTTLATVGGVAMSHAPLVVSLQAHGLEFNVVSVHLPRRRVTARRPERDAQLRALFRYYPLQASLRNQRIFRRDGRRFVLHILAGDFNASPGELRSSRSRWPRARGPSSLLGDKGAPPPPSAATTTFWPILTTPSTPTGRPVWRCCVSRGTPTFQVGARRQRPLAGAHADAALSTLALRRAHASRATRATYGHGAVSRVEKSRIDFTYPRPPCVGGKIPRAPSAGPRRCRPQTRQRRRRRPTRRRWRASQQRCAAPSRHPGRDLLRGRKALPGDGAGHGGRRPPTRAARNSWAASRAPPPSSRPCAARTLLRMGRRRSTSTSRSFPF